jgi:hypothetical protein
VMCNLLSLSDELTGNHQADTIRGAGDEDSSHRGRLWEFMKLFAMNLSRKVEWNSALSWFYVNAGGFYCNFLVRLSIFNSLKPTR